MNYLKFKRGDVVYCIYHKDIFDIRQITGSTEGYNFDVTTATYVGGYCDYVGSSLTHSSSYMVTLVEKDLTFVSKLVTIMYKKDTGV